jgi:hypothetical protein
MSPTGVLARHCLASHVLLDAGYSATAIRWAKVRMPHGVCNFCMAASRSFDSDGDLIYVRLGAAKSDRRPPSTAVQLL